MGVRIFQELTPKTPPLKLNVASTFVFSHNPLVFLSQCQKISPSGWSMPVKTKQMVFLESPRTLSLQFPPSPTNQQAVVFLFC